MRTTMALVVDAVHYIFVAMTIQPEIGLRGARLTQKATPDGTMRRFVTEQSLQIWAAKGGTWGEESAARPVECAKSQKRRPSPDSATPQTMSVWPRSVCRHAPLPASHSRTVPSAPPLAASRPSPDSATPQTTLV